MAGASAELDSVYVYGVHPSVMGNGATRGFTIGELAATSGVGVETVRFYERQGLLVQPTRRHAVFGGTRPTR